VRSGVQLLDFHMGTWGLFSGGEFFSGGGQTEKLYTSEEKTHRGRPFQSAYRGWSVLTKKCGDFEVNLSRSICTLTTASRKISLVLASSSRLSRSATAPGTSTTAPPESAHGYWFHWESQHSLVRLSASEMGVLQQLLGSPVTLPEQLHHPSPSHAGGDLSSCRPCISPLSFPLSPRVCYSQTSHHT